MFVSSYSTYITPNSSEKNSRVAKERERETKDSFSEKLFATKSKSIDSINNLKINYVLSNKTFANKQELEYQQVNLQSGEKKSLKELGNIFTKQHTLNSAKDAYLNNSKIFSLLNEPKITLSQTVVSDKRQASDIQELQKNFLRNTMVNTYLENDKYYQITA